MSEVSVVRVEDQGMILLRGEMGALDGVLGAVGLPVPEMRRIGRGAGRAVAWMSPDEALVLCPAAEAVEVARRMTDAAGDAFVTVADVSDARAVFDLRGPWADEALAKLTPADLSAVEEDEMRRSRLAQVAGAFWREEGGWRIVCFRSVGTYVHDLLDNAVAGGRLAPQPS